MAKSIADQNELQIEVILVEWNMVGGRVTFS